MVFFKQVENVLFTLNHFWKYMIHLKLYSTSACHLCELAISILESVDSREIRWEVVEISEDDALVERYGIRIPVVQIEYSDKELNWPFDRQQLMAFIKPT